MNIEFMRWEHQAAKRAADPGSGDAQQHGCDQTDVLPARNDQSRDQANNEAKDDHPNDVVPDHDPLLRIDG
jgi:hypothetical protein